jgi:hypothetical protein
MGKKIPFLLFNMANRLLGLDCAEIYKVVMNMNSAEVQHLITEYRDRGRLYSLWDIFCTDKKSSASSFILIKKAESGDGFMVEVPAISTIINIDIPQILVVPEYIKIKQDPFFVWGLVKSEKETIILVTFSFFVCFLFFCSFGSCGFFFFVLVF